MRSIVVAKAGGAEAHTRIIRAPCRDRQSEWPGLDEASAFLIILSNRTSSQQKIAVDIAKRTPAR